MQLDYTAILLGCGLFAPADDPIGGIALVSEGKDERHAGPFIDQYEEIESFSQRGNRVWTL